MNGSDCQAVGNYFSGSTSLTMSERWNGKSWSLVKSPLSSKESEAELSSVSCVSKSSCQAVGQESAGFPYAEQWNGRRWSLLPIPAPVAWPSGVSCSSSSDCQVVGYYVGNNFQGPLIDHWNGHKWSLAASPEEKGGALIQRVMHQWCW